MRKHRSLSFEQEFLFLKNSLIILSFLASLLREKYNNSKRKKFQLFVTESTFVLNDPEERMIIFSAMAEHTLDKADEVAAGLLETLRMP